MGNSIDPLALLASDELGNRAGTSEEEGAGVEGVCVVKDQSSERFKAAASILRE